LVGQEVRHLRRGGDQPSKDRLRAVRLAGELFAEAELGGESPAEYAHRHALASGLPVSIARRALGGMRRHLACIEDVVDAQRPSGVGRSYGGVVTRWVPRGGVLGVVAPSNHPMVHLEWMLALALGVRVAVRPGGRDPFTPRRLARALL